jgi:hypothetical protein
MGYELCNYLLLAKHAKAGSYSHCILTGNYNTKQFTPKTDLINMTLKC